jgi:hypothetical protein
LYYGLKPISSSFVRSFYLRIFLAAFRSGSVPAVDQLIGFPGGASIDGIVPTEAFQRAKQMLGDVKPARVLRMPERCKNGMVERLTSLSHRAARLSHSEPYCFQQVEGQETGLCVSIFPAYRHSRRRQLFFLALSHLLQPPPY